MPEQVTAEDVAFLEEYADGESWDSDRAFTLIRLSAYINIDRSAAILP